jgi:quercetin dioxygenase-like cupin family protein
MSETFFNRHNLSQGIARALTSGMETRVFPGDNMMLSFVRMEPGARGEIHSHPEEQWGVLLEGGGTRIQDGIEHQVAEGDFWQTPGGVAHGFVAGPDGAVVLDIFSPPRGDYKKAGSGFSG